MDRKLLIQTDGATIEIKECELSLLELKTVFDACLELLQNGRFPLPSGLPVFASKVEKETEADGTAG